jgi:hypothetical protein
MDRIGMAARSNRRSLLLLALGLLCMLLHAVVFAQLDTSLPIPDTSDLSNIDFSKVQEQTDTWTRLMGVSSILPMIGQALLIAGLLSWALQRSPRNDRD